MTKLIITGGRQHRVPSERPEWNRYVEALVGVLDTDSGEVDVVYRHVSPPEVRPPIGSDVFKSGSVAGNEMLVACQTEVLSLELPDFTLRATYTLPTFNDLHHVLRDRGKLLVVSTGLDCMVEMDADGHQVRCVSSLGENVEEKFDPQVDWRQVETTKPHDSHPNFVFRTDQGLWLTRFEQMDALCLDQDDLRIDIGVGKPHDGHLHDGLVWFTTVNGKLVAADPASGKVVESFDFNQLDPGRGPLGWCRGLWIGEGLALVGFSRIRQTKIRQNLSWIRHGFQLPKDYRKLPTRIAAFDLKRSKVVREWDLEGAGFGALFSILPFNF